MRYKGELCRRQSAHDTYLKHKRGAITSLKTVENYRKYQPAPIYPLPFVWEFRDKRETHIVFISGQFQYENPFEEAFIATQQDIAENQLRQDKRIAQQLI